jgi:hypothetical protein
MIKHIFTEKDTTIYERWPEKNTSVDEILELTKYTEGYPVESNLEDEFFPATYNSRILLSFDLSAISASIVSGKISSNFTASLSVRATEAFTLPLSYNIKAYAISGSWANGTGFFGNSPDITNGVSWKWRDGKLQGRIWETASLSGNATSSVSSSPHGGVWFTGSGYEVSQSFSQELPDIRMNITALVRTWLSGSIPNNGMILKFPESSENDSSVMGSIKFFSKESHTIFIPKLEFSWDDSEISGIGSFSQVSDEDFVLYTKNLRESYRDGEITKIRFGVRDRYPTLTYATSSDYLTSKRLPTSSYYSVVDKWTEEVIVPFSNGTKLSCDISGNYFRIDMSSFMPERYYKFQVKSEFEGGDVSKISDDGFIFKVLR